MKTSYFITPNGTNISCIGKNGSTAIGKAILEQLYPEKVPTMIGADASNSPGWQSFVPKVEDPNSAIVVMRDPVERFRSAVSQVRKVDKVDELITEIEDGGRLATNYHFLPVVNYLTGDSTLYKFPEHISELATALGLSDIPSVNDNSNNPPKPDLTADQLARVQAIYADDITLFESVTTPGTVSSQAAPSSPPLTKKEREAKIAEIKAARDAEYKSTLTTSFGVSFKTDLETIIDIKTIIETLSEGELYSNYKSADGTYHDITKEQFSLAIVEGIQRKSTAFVKEYTLTQQVQSAKTVDELNMIVWF